MRGILLSLALTSLVGVFGCGDDSPSSGGGDAGTSANMCPAPGEGMTGGAASAFDPCPGFEGCSCVAQSALESMSDSVDMETLNQLGECESGMGDGPTKCVPDEYINNVGPCRSMTCESLQGAEGRCIKKCIPQVSRQEEMLPQGPCGPNELCAPCYNPIDGAETGACSVAPNDSPPPESEAVVFDKCCQPEGASEPIGVCVPQDLVPEGSREMLPQDSCGSMELCAPDRFANDSSAKLETCTTSADNMGGCVPKCFPQMALQNLDPGSCAGGHACVPCSVLASLAPDRAPEECDTGGGGDAGTGGGGDAGTGGGDAG